MQHLRKTPTLEQQNNTTIITVDSRLWKTASYLENHQW